MPIPSAMKIITSTFELPTAERDSYRVGVSAKLPNGRGQYFETTVSTSKAEGLTAEEIRDRGIGDLRDEITAWAEANADKMGFIGEGERWSEVEPRLIPEWSPDGVDYEIGDQVLYSGDTYECIQAHTSQETWNPADATSLWELA